MGLSAKKNFDNQEGLICKAACVLNNLMIVLTAAFLALMWSNVYDAYYDLEYPIGMEGFWSYRTHTHKIVAAIANTIILSLVIGTLIYVRKFKPWLKALFSFLIPLSYVGYLMLDFERNYFGKFIMSIYGN